MKFAKPRYIPAFLTVVLLLGLTVETYQRPKPDDAEPFHTGVREAVAAMVTPTGWSYADGEKIPDGAMQLLKPNAHAYRVYTTPTGQFQFLLIQCRDAQDMGGHFPPVCYPASGWVPVMDEQAKDEQGKPKPRPVARRMTWTIGNRTIVGMEYEFTGNSDGLTITRTVDDLLILPLDPKRDYRDSYVCDMHAVRAAAADYLHKFYGAAQIQLIFDGAIPEKERREMFTQLIGQNMKLLTVLEHR